MVRMEKAGLGSLWKWPEKEQRSCGWFSVGKREWCWEKGSSDLC